MLGEPMVITIGGSAKSLNRTGTALDSSVYSTADRAYRVNVSHSYNKRARRVFKLTADSLVASPLIAGANISQSYAIHTVFDGPLGYDAALAKAIADGYMAYLTASSGAALTKLIGGES